MRLNLRAAEDKSRPEAMAGTSIRPDSPDITFNSGNHVAGTDSSPWPRLSRTHNDLQFAQWFQHKGQAEY